MASLVKTLNRVQSVSKTLALIGGGYFLSHNVLIVRSEKKCRPDLDNVF